MTDGKKELEGLMDLEQMELHQTKTIGGVVAAYKVTRVPGGFIYVFSSSNGLTSQFIKQWW